MQPDLLLHALLGLLPVLSFLAALLYLDSYKLVRLRTVIAVVACGLAVAGAGYFVNAWALEVVPIGFVAFTRYVSPVTEELLKAVVIIALIRAHRIGFLVDAAIFGFAVGTGFAMVENLYYLRAFPDAGLGTWIVRGFGTAIMHGGATAIFGVMGLAMLERSRSTNMAAQPPGDFRHPDPGIHVQLECLQLSPDAGGTANLSRDGRGHPVHLLRAGLVGTDGGRLAGGRPAAAHPQPLRPEIHRAGPDHGGHSLAGCGTG
jgi:hypothetical protein